MAVAVHRRRPAIPSRRPPAPRRRVSGLIARAVGRGFGQEAEGQERKVSKSKDAPNLGRMLNGCPLFFVGDDTAVNVAVAEAAAANLRGYTPLSASHVVGQMNGVEDADAVADAEGEDAAALAEAAVLESASTFIRTAVACRGGGQGAAARGACWRHIFAGVSVWLDGRGAKAKPLPQDEAYSLAEVKVVFDAGADPARTAQAILPKVEEALAALLTNYANESKKRGMPEAQQSLASKKLLYVKLGARGDWPDLAPPEWQPDD